MKSFKYVLYDYSTENIGDEVQSIAARRFLPKVDGFINRDLIKLQVSEIEEPTKMIMNGWYMHKPENWPPNNKHFKPLLVSMFVDQKNPEVVKSFLSKESRDFFNQNGPVGARDESTLKFFEKNNIQAYFSGCMTLTLERDESIPRQDFILAVDVSAKIIELLKSQTDRRVISISTYYNPDLKRDDRFCLAEYFLYLYQSAHCVVTTRLHAMLPSLAFETPILLVKEKGKFDKNRYSGLADLALSVNEDDYVNNPAFFDINNPPKNNDNYKIIRENLIKRCSEFTGYSNPKHCYRTIDFEDLHKQEWFIDIFFRTLSNSYVSLLTDGDLAWCNEKLKDKKRQLNLANAENKEIQRNIDILNKKYIKLTSDYSDIINSTSWKITGPIRHVSSNIQKVFKRYEK